jgi:rubredoxin/uncharacterized membrane protein
MKKWKCTVCGYIHTGEEPPEICPVCGADKSKFILVTDTSEDSAPDARPDSPADAKAEKTPSKPKPEDRTEAAKSSPAPKPGLFSYETATNLMVKHHLHPITVHFPNGVIPVAVVFVFLAVFFQFAGLSKASFYNMLFVVLTLPVALFTGYNEWQKKYHGAMTHIFKIKLISAAVVTVCAVIVVLWHLIAPDTFKTGAGMRTLFLLLHLIMLAATGIAGHIGGKLVFKD